MTATPPTSGSVAGAVGLVIDRTLQADEVVCTAWLIADYRAVTLASALLPFEKNLKAISVNFAKAGKECGVSKVSFHPNLDRELLEKQIRRGISFDSWEAALQKYNCAILHLTDELPEMNAEDFDAIQKTLSVQQTSGEGFSGSLKNIELPLVLQTISGSMQDGILYLCDDSERPIAQMLFKQGVLLSARFKNLSNEAAIYQIVEKQIKGRFVFRDCDISDWLMWLPAGPITKQADMILLDAMRRFDELRQIKTELRADRTYFVRAHPQLDVQTISEDVAGLAPFLWRVLDGMTIADDLWLLLGVDDYSVYRVLRELHLNDQIRRVQEGGTRQISSSEMKPDALATWSPLPLGPDLPLSPEEELTAISLDIDASLGYANAGLRRALKSKLGMANQSKSANAGSTQMTEADKTRPAVITQATTKTRIKAGALLGAIDAYDSLHLLHETPLLPMAAGVPLLKDGLVIGMHCGVVPISVDPDNMTGVKQLMVWIEVVIDCLKAAGEIELSKKFMSPKSAGDKQAAARKKIRPPGCNEIASLKCPSCGTETFDSARSCGQCKYVFVPLNTPLNTVAAPSVPLPSAEESGGGLAKFLGAVGALSMVGLTGLIIFWMTIPAPLSQSLQFVVLDAKPVEPSDALVKLRTMWTNPSAKTEKWIAKPAMSTLTNDDRVKFQVDAFQSSHVYLFARGRWSDKAVMIYPVAAGWKNLLEERQALHTSKFRVRPPKGSETVLVVASKTPQPWLEDPNWYNPLFDLASHLPQNDLVKSGYSLKLERNQTAPASASEPKQEPAELFLSSVTVDH